jgi:hypothetical protein
LLPLDLLLIVSDLFILPVIFIFLALKLIADKRACTQPQTAANRRTYAWPPHSSTNKTTRSRATESANPGPLFSGR